MHLKNNKILKIILIDCLFSPLLTKISALYPNLSILSLRVRIKISVNTDISVIGFYGNIGNIGKISVDIFTKISVIKIFHILII